MKTKFLIPLIAGLGLFCACKNKSGYEVVNNSSSADSVKVESTAGPQPKLVKTAGMHFKVKNVQQTSEKIAALTTSVSGMVMHHQMGSAPDRTTDVRISDDSVMRVTSFNTTADMTVKVPSAKLDDFMNQVANLGINDAVKNSIVTLSFYQSNTINKEVIANDDPSAYSLPFYKRIGMAIEGGWALFVDVIIGLANIWVFILAGIGVWMVIRYYKNKKVVSLVKAE